MSVQSVFRRLLLKRFEYDGYESYGLCIFVLSICYIVTIRIVCLLLLMMMMHAMSSRERKGEEN